MDPINRNWTNVDSTHDGGVSTGIGYTIAWQRGPLNDAGRNGAFVLEVLDSCLNQVQYFQDTFLPCPENAAAIEHLNAAIAALESRRNQRKQAGVLGTTEP
jgi:hypothetical protein